MNSCHLCGRQTLIPLLNFGEHPIAHNFLTSPSEEEYVHAVNLSYCESCGLIQLVDPIPPELLYTEYVCLSSWKAQPHLPRLVQLVEELPGVDRKSGIIEIGSNDGIFLEALRAKGYENLLGVEPAQDAVALAHSKNIETVNTYFSPESAREIASTYGQCRLLVARQVLEHISDLESFRQGMRHLLAPGAHVLIEVPNFAFSLAAPDYSAIWEEHVNYFTPETLGLFLSGAGVRVTHAETFNFSGEALVMLGEYVGAESSSQPEFDNALPKLLEQAISYKERWPVFRNELIEYLAKHRDNGGQVAIYGAGCRAASIINFAGLAPYLNLIVDDQPEKQGKYMPGARLPIIAGDRLPEHDVDLCLLAVNAENEEKVIAKHRQYEEQGGRFASIHPPSRRLLPLWNHIQ